MTDKLYTTSEYLEKNPTWHVEDSPWKAQKILSLLKKHNIQPTSVAEVGCGAGEILAQLYSAMPYDVEFSGYDISPQALLLSKTREQDRLHFYLKDMLRTKEHFDVVLVMDVIEHVEDYLGFLKKLHNRGTNIIFHIPLDVSVQTVLRKKPIMELRNSVGHLHYFTKETALASLKDAGYEIIDWEYTAASVDLSARSYKSLITRLPRKILFALNQDLAVRVMGRYSLLVLAQSTSNHSDV